MPAIILKNKENGACTDEFLMVELQGDLDCREEIEDCSEKFVGDLVYNLYGNPILIVGHHILFGKVQTMERPFALIEKVPKQDSMDIDDENEGEIEIQRKFDSSIIPDDTVPNASFSILDTTVNIENRTKPQVEYRVKAFIKKKLVFNQRPRPIVSNVPKQN